MDVDPAKIALIPRLQARYDEFKSNCTAIDLFSTKQELVKTGPKKVKNSALDAVITEVMDLLTIINACASETENQELMSKATMTETTLRRMPDTELYSAGKAVLDLALENADACTEFGLTEAMTDHLAATLEAYNKAIPQPRLGIEESVKVTTTLAQYFAKNDALLKKMDKLMKLAEKSDPDFVRTFFSLRKITNYAKRSLAMLQQVIDAATRESLANANVVIETAVPEGMKASSGADLVKVVKKTESKGGSRVKSLAEGSYIITVSRPGYVTQTVTVTVVKGELCKVVIELVKE